MLDSVEDNFPTPKVCASDRIFLCGLLAFCLVVVVDPSIRLNPWAMGLPIDQLGYLETDSANWKESKTQGISANSHKT